MNIKQKQRSTKPTLEQTKHVYNAMFMHQAISHYPNTTIMDMNNYLLVTFYRAADRSLRSDIYSLYRKISYAANPANKGIFSKRVGAIAYLDYTGSRSGKNYSNANLTNPDHCHMLVLARSIPERDAIKKVLDKNNEKYSNLHYADVTDTKNPLDYLLSYLSKAYGHEYSGFANDKYFPISLPFDSIRKKKYWHTLSGVANKRYQSHPQIMNQFTLS